MTTPTLTLSFENIEISQNEDASHENASCTVLLKNKMDKENIFSYTLKISEKSDNIVAPTNPDHYLLKLLFISPESKNLGSISLPYELFFPFQDPRSFSQWLTLFDDPEDDMFDGELGQDDYEHPRALMTFSLNMSNIKLEEENHMVDSFGALSLNNSNQVEINIRDSNLLEKFNPKDVNFDDQPEELIKHFDIMLNHINTPEDLITATHKINEFRDELEHPMANQYIKRSSSFQPKSEEFHIIEKFNKEYEEEIGLLKLKIKRLEGIQGEYNQLKNEKKICEDKYDNLLKSYQESIISMEERVKELLKKNNFLIEKSFILEQENSQKNKNIEELSKSNNSLTVEIRNLTDLNHVQEQEILEKNQNFENFMKDFKGKFERLKEKLQNEEKSKLSLITEQKELVLKYKQQIEQNSYDKQGLRDLETKSKFDIEKIQVELEKQNKVYQQEIDNLTKNLHERDWVIKQMEEEKAYNLKQFQDLKNEINELRKEKNESMERFNNLVEEYEMKILILEKEKNNLQITKTNNEMNYHSERQEELLEKTKMLEAQIIENENYKEKLQSQWIEAHCSLEEKLKEVEKIKEDFINRFLEDNKLKQIQIEENEKSIFEKNRKISEMEFKINEQNAKLNCENYWSTLVQKLKKKIKDFKKSIEILDIDKQKLHKGLYKVTQELIRQTNVTIDQSHTINLLSTEIQRLEANLQAAQEQLELKIISKQKNNSTKTSEEQILPEKIEKIEIPNITLKRNELDDKLDQYVKDQQIPLSFEKLSDGQYRFGTRIVQAKIWKDKIAIRMGGGFMIIQEFIRLFMLQELNKIKKSGRFSLDNSKNPTPKELVDNTSGNNRKDTNSNLKKHMTLENLEQNYYLNPSSNKDFI